ncbi:hypothetical protein Ocin01_20176 [Orchesella cincta]|uniref:Uncharacterized protein n=1 Tax=Orchesella cincta TaxID=48709 RepID=A0A1D2M0L8_ORCCI|nr:hypothetical protein Ocin01_20176 [Orchesella cincta]
MFRHQSQCCQELPLHKFCSRPNSQCATTKELRYADFVNAIQTISGKLRECSTDAGRLIDLSTACKYENSTRFVLEEETVYVDNVPVLTQRATLDLFASATITIAFSPMSFCVLDTENVTVEYANAIQAGQETVVIVPQRKALALSPKAKKSAVVMEIAFVENVGVKEYSGNTAKMRVTSHAQTSVRS